MEKSKVISIMYEESETIQTQGKRKDIQRYINNGYYIKEDRNGYWVLTKPVRVNVTLNNSFGTRIINLKEDICEYYGRKRISKSLVNKFETDVKYGKISIYLDEVGNYSLK